MDAVRLDDPGEELPCCRIEICYLCFRGLTVVLVMIGAPALASLILWIFVSFRARRICRSISTKDQRRGYHSPATGAQEIVSFDSAITIDNAANSRQRSLDADYDVKEDEDFERHVSQVPSDILSVHRERPCIRTVLQSLWSIHEDEAHEANISVYVCGPRRLNVVVQEEAERQQKQNFANQYDLIVL